MTAGASRTSLPISDEEFEQFSALIRERAGIYMTPAKKALVAGRLGKRLRYHGLSSFGAYYRLITQGQAGKEELQTLVDLLTTNETYFFREESHFDFLRQHVIPSFGADSAPRFWSAACSSGEEAYTLGMILAETLGLEREWSIFGSDVSTQMVSAARRATYPMEASQRIPREYLKRYCLRGTGNKEGVFLIQRKLRERTRFEVRNLSDPDEELPGGFDVIFLRNILIYFDLPTKQAVVGRLAESLKPGGWLLVGHSETLNTVSDRFETVQPSIYRKRS